MDGNESRNETVTTGVPQGTILGPLIFILYFINTNVQRKFTFLCGWYGCHLDQWFMDRSRKENEYIYIWKFLKYQEFSHNNAWLALNRLSLNLETTVFITFGNYCVSVTQKINIQLIEKMIKQLEHYSVILLITI